MKINSKLITLIALFILTCCSGKTSSSKLSKSSQEDVSSSQITYGEQSFNFANSFSAVKINEGHEEEFKAMFKESNNLELESYELDGYVGFDLGGIKLGSSKETGRLTLNFNYKVSKIIFSTSPYYKEYDGQVNFDDTKISINDYSSKVEKVDYPTSIIYDAITENNYSKNIVIKNEQGGTTKSGRLIIYSMIVTYIIA